MNQNIIFPYKVPFLRYSALEIATKKLDSDHPFLRTKMRKENRCGQWASGDKDMDIYVKVK
jgi:hypothetical protein